MIQRKQTIFLLLALVATIVCMCMPLGFIEPKGMCIAPVLYNLALRGADGAYDFNVCPLFFLLAIASILSLATIFTYKKRKLQMRLCRLNLVSICLWYAFLVYLIFVGFKETGVFHQSWTAFLPFVSAVFQTLAHRGIVADEKLVRAADRIR